MFFVVVGNNQEWSGMISLKDCWALLGIADYDNNQWGPLSGLVFEGHKDSPSGPMFCMADYTLSVYDLNIFRCDFYGNR